MGKTSSDVKRRYNDKVYSSVSVHIRKELVAEFKRRCKELDISQASVVQEAIEDFLARH